MTTLPWRAATTTVAKGAAIGVGAVGFLLVWSGIDNAGVLSSVRDLLAGNRPTPGPRQSFQFGANGLPGANGSTGGSVPASASDIANAFLKYEGKVPYVWGGASPKGWDCSGSVNYVLCHDLQMGIPGGIKGGQFTGSSHGPTTLQYLTWSGAKGVPGNVAQAGDLCCWQTHIGIAVDPNNYISAYDTADGTVVKPIASGGPIGEKLFVRRIASSSVPGGIFPTPSGNSIQGSLLG